MFENFSEVEKKYLNELKISLLEHPGDYFFRPYRSFNDFKKINYPMWIGQWQYVNSGFSLILETFKILGKVAGSLFALNFSNAASLAYDASQECLTALTKLTLALGLLCLNLCRSLTLFVATFYPQLVFASLTVCSAYLYFMVLGTPLLEALALTSGSVFLGIFGGSITGTLAKNRAYSHKQRETSLEGEFFESFCKKMFEEQRQVYEFLREFKEKHKLVFQELKQDQRFFSGAEQRAIECMHVHIETTKLCVRLSELLTSYPEVSIGLARKDRDYAHMTHKELTEHHAKVMSMAELLAERIDKSPENESEEYNSLISM